VFKRILVPLDGSNLAEKVLPAAVYLAGRLQATLILFHVVEKDAPDEIHDQHHLRQASEAKAYLGQVAEKYAQPGLTILQDVHEVQETGVAQTIRDHAVELRTGLIIMCAHGSGGIRDMLNGSIAQQVIRQGEIPVLFIRPENRQAAGPNLFRKILIPLDGSKAHETAIPKAVALALKCEAQIRLLTVVPTTETISVKEAITSRVSPRMSRLFLDNSAQQAEEYLQGTAQAIAAQGVPVSGLVERGDTLAKMIDTIANEGIDLVVMATHGHNVIDAHWEGNLTPQFLPKTPAPVLLVHGIQDDRE
jgi:nucleotide-binding universal stress UspA family protein